MSNYDDYLEFYDGSSSSYDEDEDEVSLTDAKENMIPNHLYHQRSLLVISKLHVATLSNRACSFSWMIVTLKTHKRTWSLTSNRN